MSGTAEKLIAEIKQDIADGILKPGDQLEEAHLARRFSVSRTPIREAVRSMVDCGLLETRPRKGAFVRCLTTKELLDMFEVAAELESLACRLAADGLTDEGAATLQKALTECRDAADRGQVARYSRANLLFHSAIHEASGNRFLVEQLKVIELQINPYRALPYDVRGRLTKSCEEHAAICKAVCEGDAAHAQTLMHDHMMLQGHRLPSLVDAVESLKATS